MERSHGEVGYNICPKPSQDIGVLFNIDLHERSKSIWVPYTPFLMRDWRQCQNQTDVEMGTVLCPENIIALMLESEKWKDAL